MRKSKVICNRVAKPGCPAKSGLRSCQHAEPHAPMVTCGRELCWANGAGSRVWCKCVLVKLGAKSVCKPVLAWGVKLKGTRLRKEAWTDKRSAEFGRLHTEDQVVRVEIHEVAKK